MMLHDLKIFTVSFKCKLQREDKQKGGGRRKEVQLELPVIITNVNHLFNLYTWLLRDR